LLFLSQPSNISIGLKGGVLLRAVLQGMAEPKDIGVEFVFSYRADFSDKGGHLFVLKDRGIDLSSL
jgi:hypothetical protein